MVAGTSSAEVSTSIEGGYYPLLTNCGESDSFAAQASCALLQQPSMPGLLLLQDKARMLRATSREGLASKVAEQSDDDANAERFEAVPDSSEMLGQINQTFIAVDEILDEANTTVTETLQSVLHTSQTFLDALDKLKATAETMKIVLGADTVESVLSMVQRLKDVLLPLMTDLQSTADKIQVTLDKILALYDAERDKVYKAFTAAVAKVAALNPDSNATDFLQRDFSGGLPGWLNSILGGGKGSPCQQALAAIKKANGTAIEVFDMLTSLNATLSSEVIGKVLQSTTRTLDESEERFNTAMAASDGMLPAAISDGMKKVAQQFFSMSDKLTANVQEREAEIRDKIEKAQSEAESLYTIVSVLAQLAGSYECGTGEP